MSERVTAEQLREQYAEQFKDEQPAEVIYQYQCERFAAADEIDRLIAEIERLRDLLKRALPSVEADAAMMGAMERHAPLPAQDMPSVTAAANDLDALLADIRSSLQPPKEGT